MPFELSNAPSTFQATMNSIFWHVALKSVLVFFFNDIFVYSASWDLYLQHLHEVFNVLSSNSFHAKLSKCEFGSTTLAYLGYIVSEHGVSVDPDKIQAIQQWPIPSSVRQFCGFLDLTGYYNRFFPHYARLATLLT